MEGHPLWRREEGGEGRVSGRYPLGLPVTMGSRKKDARID